MNNSRRVIQPALAVCIGDAARLLVASFSTHFSALSSGWMKMASKACEHFHECVQSTLRTHRCCVRTQHPKYIQVEGCDEILDPLKHPKNLSRSIKIILPKNKNSYSLFLAVWVYESGCMLCFSRCVYLHCSSLPFSLYYITFMYKNTLNPWTYFSSFYARTRFCFFFAHSLTRSIVNDKLFNAFSYGGVFCRDDDDDIELAKVIASERIWRYQKIHFMK